MSLPGEGFMVFGEHILSIGRVVGGASGGEIKVGLTEGFDEPCHCHSHVLWHILNLQHNQMVINLFCHACVQGLIILYYTCRYWIDGC